MSDYYYVKAVLNYLSLEDKVYVLPSVGAPNVNRLVSIMIGWGCDFKVLLDFDREGWREYKKLTKHLDAEYMRDKIIFVNSKNFTSQSEVNDNPMTIEDIIDEDLVNDYPELDKTLIAKRLYEAVNESTYKLSDSTKEKFKGILEQLDV
ncbi:hypothetical protein [Salinicoccus roseus]|uniref:hypothetical protein n=1 Tax=Salinicoccus roseus TaxID=45670 RepID=UPI0023008CE5|nr:hypothetical protein [Salinicoccus roseus]